MKKFNNENKVKCILEKNISLKPRLTEVIKPKEVLEPHLCAFVITQGGPVRLGSLKN